MADMLKSDQYRFAGDSSVVVHIAHVAEQVSWVRTMSQFPSREYRMLCGVYMAPRWMAVTRSEGALCEDCALLASVVKVNGGV